MIRVLVVLPILVLSSCATLVSIITDGEHVAVTSEPPGAEVCLDGVVVGRTPCTFAVRRKSLGTVTVTAAEKSVTHQLHWQVNPWAYGNFLAWGFVGLLVDLTLGHTSVWSEDPLHFDLGQRTVNGDVPNAKRKVVREPFWAGR